MIDHAELYGFRASFDGPVLTPEGAGYDQVRRDAIWNADIDRRPALIVQPATPEQVSTAVDFGRRLGLEITVRGGGHSCPGHGICDDGLGSSRWVDPPCCREPAGILPVAPATVRPTV
jgi:hypothetical protein